MIVLDEKIVGVWFVGYEKTDLLAAIRELKRDEEYELTFRFRYHKDEKIFDSKDEKHWSRGLVHGTRLLRYFLLAVYGQSVCQNSERRDNRTFER